MGGRHRIVSGDGSSWLMEYRWNIGSPASGGHPAPYQGTIVLEPIWCKRRIAIGKQLGHSCNIGNAPSLVGKKLKTVICVFWMYI